MRARSGRVPNWMRAQPSCCGCGAWAPGCDRVPPRATIGSCRQRTTWMRDRRARWAREGERMANILVCDDERSICEMLDIALRREGHKIETVNSGEAAKRKIDGALYDLIITDIKMPNIDGIEVLRHAHGTSPESAVILITAVDDYEAAVKGVRAGGASDYIRKGRGLVYEMKLPISRSLW